MNVTDPGDEVSRAVEDCRLCPATPPATTVEITEIDC
jgi:hypothetical protein